MSPHFGTSGPTGGAVHVERDLRPSYPTIARDVIHAVRRAGLTAFDHGDILTPGLAHSHL
jgi:phosphomannomutase